jgi:hypothetical protein
MIGQHASILAVVCWFAAAASAQVGQFIGVYQAPPPQESSAGRPVLAVPQRDGAGQKQEARSDQPGNPSAPMGRTRTRHQPRQIPVRLEASIHQVELTSEQGLLIDPDALARVANSPAELHEALAKLGPTTLIYRIDQTVQLTPGSGSQAISVSADVPYVTGISESQRSGSVLSINRERVGAVLKVSVQPPPSTDASPAHAPPPGVIVEIDVSTMTPSQVAVPGGAQTPVFRRISVGDAFAPFGRPHISVAVDAASTGPDGKGFAAITRIRATLVEPPPGGATSPQEPGTPSPGRAR